jgi:hypothetical protein
MATREKIKIDGSISLGFNLCDPVGIGGVNKHCDVFTIQGWFHYLGSIGRLDGTGAKSAAELPGMTGRYDSKLGNAILNYQRLNSAFLKSVDGLIHPASYAVNESDPTKNPLRNIESVKGQYMTITLLHIDTITGPDGRLGYTDSMLSRYPVLAMCIRTKD